MKPAPVGMPRRDFLKKTTAAFAAATAFPYLVVRAKDEPTAGPNERVNGACCGIGVTGSAAS